MYECIFCKIKDDINEVVLENDLAYLSIDKNPVSKGHMVIITKRHIDSYFELSLEEKKAIDDLMLKAKEMVDKWYQPTGYNIGVNCGLSAGQTVMHVHVHLIPRYDGDVENPRGGVRGVIPDKQSY